MKPLTSISMAALTVLLAACNINFTLGLPTPSPDNQTPTVSVTATATSPYLWPDETGTCTLTLDEATTLYDRPSAEAQVFAEGEAGFSAVVAGRTFDGWVGFDPGIAQAANVGIFRLRWVHFDNVSLSGDCVSVPQAGWVPQAELCYTMPQSSVNVYTNANTSSNVLTTLNAEQFASVSGFTDDGWAQVDLGAGNTGQSGIGWMQAADLNLNGGTCDELPMVSP